MSPTCRGRLYVLLPLAFFGLDLLIAPKISDHGEKLQPVRTVRLLIDKQLHLGAFRTHPIHVTFDTVGDSDYLASVAAAKPNALVVSGFVRSRKDGMVVGAFASAVFQKLDQLAPEEARRLKEFMQEIRDFEPGDVRDFELRLDPAARELFPFDHVFVACLAHTTGEYNMEHQLFEKVMRRLFERAQASDLRNIVIPVIGYNYSDKNGVELAYFFRSFFSAMQPSSDPAAIWIDVYAQWPTTVLESVVTSFNTALSQVPAEVKTNRFYRQRVRGLYLLLILCLLSTSYVIRLTWKTAAMVTFFFTLAYLGLDKGLEPFLADLPRRTQLIVAAIVYLMLAALFPIVARWDLHDLFKKRRKAHEHG